MDWTTPLRSQQEDFIKRLATSSARLHYLTDPKLQGFHSELVVVKGEELGAIDQFCWNMVDRYGKRSSQLAQNIFINNMKGKLGELVVQKYLDALITPLDLDKKPGGDGGIDFRLNSDPTVCIQVKARYDTIKNVRWFVSRDEIERNAVLVCIWIKEEITPRQNEYNLVLAGFLPTNLIKDMINRKSVEIRGNRISLSFEDLLYGGGLKSYLELSRFIEETNSFSVSLNLEDGTADSSIPSIGIGSWKRLLSLEDIVQLETTIQELKKNYAHSGGTNEGSESSADISTYAYTQDELNKIWQDAIKHMHPLSKALMGTHGKLVSLTEQEAVIHVDNEKLCKLAQGKIKDLEEAFLKLLDREIRVSMTFSK